MTNLETLKAARLRLDDPLYAIDEKARDASKNLLDGAILDEEMTQQKLAIVHLITGGRE